PRRPFTLLSSRALRAFLEERGVPRDRISPLEDAIDFHMQMLPRWSKGATAGLLQVGAWMDVTFLRRWAIRAEAREIAAALPRAGFDLAFPVKLLGSIRRPAACLGLLLPGPYRPV